MNSAESKSQLTQRIKQAAIDCGFDVAASCAAVTPEGLSHFHDWLEAGYHGEMSYLETRRDAYQHPRFVLDGAQSVVMLATNYRSEESRAPEKGSGRISRYAWGTEDYHELIHRRLKQLKRSVADFLPEANVRGVVDTAPLLEREFAKLAGIGWQGKNTMLISKNAGSYFFLSCLLLDVELEYDAPFETDHCGTCTACLDACPTDAFVSPHVLDATKCISYLTIELRDDVPKDLREGMGDWMFGCDVCQDVCPWNRHAPIVEEPPFAPNPDLNPIELRSLFDLDDDSFRARFRKTPLWRAKRRGILRNAAIVLGNQQDALAIDALAKGLGDVEPMVRRSCAWAIGRICENAGDERVVAKCVEILKSRYALETDSSCRKLLETTIDAI